MTYTVRLGDTPMGIAQHFTGDPMQVSALVAANRHKPRTVVNGIVTFLDLRVGELLVLPWRTSIGSVGSLVGLGQGGSLADFAALVDPKSPLYNPNFANSWSEIHDTLTADHAGSSQLSNILSIAQGKMADAFNQIGKATDVGSLTVDPSEASKGLVLGQLSIGGAIAQVDTLVQQAQNIKQPSQAINLVVGTMVGMAVAAGAVSAGIGAAIVVAGSLFATAFDSVSPPPNLPCGCAHGWGQPSYAIGCLGVFGQRINDPSSYDWRKFPDSNNPDDSAWFTKQWSSNDGFASINGWPKNYPTTWQACVPGKRLIDAIDHYQDVDWLVYHADNEVSDPAERDFLHLYVEAWKLNQTFALNGNVPPKKDWEALVHALHVWNTAHESGSGIFWNSVNGPSGAPATYLDGVLADVIAWSGVDMPNNLMRINNGPKKTPSRPFMIPGSAVIITQGGNITSVSPGTLVTVPGGGAIVTPSGNQPIVSGKKPLSTGAKVGIGVLVIGAASTGWLYWYSRRHHMTMGQTLKGMGQRVKATFRRHPAPQYAPARRRRRR